MRQETFSLIGIFHVKTEAFVIFWNYLTSMVELKYFICILLFFVLLSSLFFSFVSFVVVF